MSGHVRFGFAAFVFGAGFAAAVAGWPRPAAANPLTDLFSKGPAPETAAPAPAPEQCLRQPGRAASGGHWVYRYDDSHRKCWFQAEAGPAVANEPSRSRLARRPVTALTENQPAPRQQEDVEDARAELTTSPSAEVPEPTLSTPKVTVVRTVPVHIADAAAQIPPAPVPAGAGQPAQGRPAPRQVDVEQLLADARAASEDAAPAAAATPVTASSANSAGGEERTAAWFGVLLIALGGAALLSASPALRQALSSLRIPDALTRLPATAQAPRSDPSFAAARIPLAAAGQDELLASEPQGMAPSADAGPVGRTVAPAPPSPQARWEAEIGALAMLSNSVSPEAFARRRAIAYGGVEQRAILSGS